MLVDPGVKKTQVNESMVYRSLTARGGKLAKLHHMDSPQIIPYLPMMDPWDDCIFTYVNGEFFMVSM